MSRVQRIVFFSTVLSCFTYESSYAHFVELMRKGKNYESLPLPVNSSGLTLSAIVRSMLKAMFSQIT